jgi:hypothetical protein
MWSEDWFSEETDRASQLTYKIIEIDPDDFVRLITSGEPTTIGNDIKHLYLLWRRFNSQGAIKSLEELAILVIEAEGQIGEWSDASVLRRALQEFKDSVSSQVSQWKSDLREN